MDIRPVLCHVYRGALNCKSAALPHAPHHTRHTRRVSRRARVPALPCGPRRLLPVCGEHWGGQACARREWSGRKQHLLAGRRQACVTPFLRNLGEPFQADGLTLHLPQPSPPLPGHPLARPASLLGMAFKPCPSPATGKTYEHNTTSLHAADARRWQRVGAVA